MCMKEMAGARVPLESRVGSKSKPLYTTRAISVDDSLCVDPAVFGSSGAGALPRRGAHLQLSCPDDESQSDETAIELAARTTDAPGNKALTETEELCE